MDDVDPLPATALAALALAAVQIVPRFVPRLEGDTRQSVLSGAGGFSAAFVFLELLPQVRERADVVEEDAAVLTFSGDATFFLALVGLLAFYGLEALARRTRRRGAAATHDEAQTDATDHAEALTDDAAGLVHIAAFGGYYGLIGYLLWAQAGTVTGDLVPFTVAVGVHFLVVDYGLQAHHRASYRRVGRWFLAAMVLLGWGLGALVTVPEVAVGIGVAFLAGGVMLITLKEELPDQAEGHFPAFCLGAIAFVALVTVL